MLKNILALLCFMLLFAGCVKTGDNPSSEMFTETPYVTTEIPTETPYVTTETPAETPYTTTEEPTGTSTETPPPNASGIEPSGTPRQHTYETPPQEPPVILDYVRRGVEYDCYDVDYVYLTDGTNTVQWTPVKEGDTFLGLYVEGADAHIEKYDDGSIAYWSCSASFSGEIEIKNARIEYYIDTSYSEDYGEVIVYVPEESYHLFPKIVCYENSGRRFRLYESEEVDRLIDEEFGGKAGVIDNCNIVIRDIGIWFAYTSGLDGAEFVELIKD